MRRSLTIFFLSTLNLFGCAHKPEINPSSEGEILRKSTWHDATLSESLLSAAKLRIDTPEGTSRPLSFQDLMHAGRPSRGNVTPQSLTDLDYYRRISFYLGAVGGIYSFIADSQGNVRGRTLGNAVWGIGWTCWLGFGAVVRADIRQIMDEHNEAIGTDSASVFGSNDTDHLGSSWAILWQLRSF